MMSDAIEIELEKERPLSVLLAAARELEPELPESLIQSCYRELRKYQFDRDSERLSLQAVRSLIEAALDNDISDSDEAAACG